LIIYERHQNHYKKPQWRRTLLLYITEFCLIRLNQMYRSV